MHACMQTYVNMWCTYYIYVVQPSNVDVALRAYQRIRQANQRCVSTTMPNLTTPLNSDHKHQHHIHMYSLMSRYRL